MIYGSSVINLTNQGSSGSFTGPSGPRGTTGATGATGESITGPVGPTGYGITGATYNSSSAGVTFYVRGISPINLNLRGPSGANGTGFLVLHGITHTLNNNSKSILVSDDLYESQKNEIIIDQDETIYFKSINFKSINGEIEQITFSKLVFPSKQYQFDSISSIVINNTTFSHPKNNRYCWNVNVPCMSVGYEQMLWNTFRCNISLRNDNIKNGFQLIKY